MQRSLCRPVHVIAALIAILSLLLAACGSAPQNATNTSAAPEAATASEPASTAAEPAASVAASGDVVTVRWWSWNGGPGVPGAEPGSEPQAVIAFNEAHDNVKIEWKWYQYADYLNALKLGMVSGEGPDLIGVQAGAMIKEYNEFLEDLTPYASKTWGADWQDRFYELGLLGLTDTDKTSALPFMVSAAGELWYNKTKMDSYGLQPPTTWDEWIAVCEQLNSNGETCFIQGAKDAWVNYDMYIALANELAPGKIYEAEAGTVPWTDPDLVKAMDYWKQLFSNGIMQNGALGASQYPDAHDAWTKGEAVMILFGLWNNYHMTKQSRDGLKTSLGFTEDFEMLPIMFPDVNGDGKPGRFFGNVDVGLAMNANSQNKDAVWEVISWMLDTDGQQIHAKVLNIPSVKGIEVDESDIITDEQRAALEQQLEDLPNAVGVRELTYPEIKTALADALQAVASGTQTPEQAMEAVEQVSQSVKR